MSTTLNVDMAKWAGTDVTGPVTLTYEGGSPQDAGPAGAVLRMLVAQVSNDSDGLADAVTEETLAMGKPSLPGKQLEVRLGEIVEEGETRVVPARLLADGQEQELAFVTVKVGDQWRVDMPATIQRLMGAGMGEIMEVMEKGMQAMADGMSEAMKGIGQTMSEALAATAIPPEEETPAHPDLAQFRQSVIDCVGVHWRVEADWESFDAAEGWSGPLPGLPEGTLQLWLAQMLDGIVEFTGRRGIATEQLGAVKTFCLRKSSSLRSDLEREGERMTYALGVNEDGTPNYLSPGEVSKVLWAVLT